MMSKGGLSTGASLAVFDEIDSTSLESRRRAAAGERGPVWIVARRQTAGYGRRGGTWLQNPGDLAATLLFEPGAPLEQLSLLSLAAGVAVAETLAAIAPGAAFELKWPNDVMADGAKIAGILVESLDTNGAQPLVSVGVGVNLADAPKISDYPTASLRECLSRDRAPASAPEPLGFLDDLDRRLGAVLRLWRRGGSRPIIERWTSRAYGLGAIARISAPGGAAAGAIVGVDDTGALILATPEGDKRIVAGSLTIETTRN